MTEWQGWIFLGQMVCVIFAISDGLRGIAAAIREEKKK